MVALASRIRGPEGWECSICYDEGNDPVILHTHETTQDPITAKKIDHIFHRTCIERWLARCKEKKCPLCAWEWGYKRLKPWVPTESESRGEEPEIVSEPITEISEAAGRSVYSIIKSIVLTILIGIAVVWALMNGIPLVG